MKGLKGSYTSMSVKDLAQAKKFYTETLGLDVSMDAGENMFMLDCGGGTRCMVYPKDDHKPATHTVLNLDVENIEAAVNELTENGVEFNKDGTDEKGIAEQGPAKMAWFNDPAGNFISVTENI